MRPGEDKQINLWDQLDTFSKLDKKLLDKILKILVLASLENMCIDFIDSMRPGG